MVSCRRSGLFVAEGRAAHCGVSNSGGSKQGQDSNSRWRCTELPLLNGASRGITERGRALKDGHLTDASGLIDGNIRQHNGSGYGIQGRVGGNGRNEFRGNELKERQSNDGEHIGFSGKMPLPKGEGDAQRQMGGG